MNTNKQNAIESFVTIDIDTNINEGSLSKNYKWITSLELISMDQFKDKIFVKDRPAKHDQMVKHFQIDKLLYLVVTFCQEGKFPITRIRTRKQVADHQWKVVPYPKQFQDYYQLNICYQHTQSKQCKRIITDIQVCHSKQLENLSKGEQQWQIATIPEIQIFKNQRMTISKNQKQTLQKNDRQTRSESQQFGQNQRSCNNAESVDSKLSDRSWARQNNSNLSDNSYYSCNQNQTESKSSIQKDNFSELDEKYPSHNSIERESKKSSLSEFHSMEEVSGPFYFLMKSIDLYDCHNQFQYTYEPKVASITKLQKNTIQQQYLLTLPIFCFPNGIKLFKKISGCGYQIFTIILTDQKGERYFAYCLKYIEKMKHSTQRQLLKQLYDLNLIDKNQIYKDQQIFYEKAFLFISKNQNTDFYHKILHNLYRVLLSFTSPKQGLQYFPNKLKIPQEERILYYAHDLDEKLRNFIKNLEKKVPIRKLDSPLKQIPSNGDKMRKAQFKWCGLSAQLNLKESENRLSQKSLYCLLKLLTVENILKILSAILLQKKVFLVSNIQISIFLSIEALCGLVYPLKLSQTIIPIINQKLIDYIETPFPIVAGIVQDLVNQQTLSKAIYVFLDCNRILTLDQIPSHPSAFMNILKQLKKHQLYNLQHINQFLNYKDIVYTFGVHEVNQYSLEKHETIKLIFRNGIIDIIKTYVDHFSNTAMESMQKQKNLQKQFINTKLIQSERLSRATTSSESQNKHLTFKQIYDCQSFTKSHIKKQQNFYKQLCNSGIFISLVQEKFNQPESQNVKKIDRLIELTNEDIVNHFSCLALPMSSKKQKFRQSFNDNLDNKKFSAIKSQLKQNKVVADQRGSLTNIKPHQIMRKHMSTQEQQKKSSNINSHKRKMAVVDVNKKGIGGEKFKMECNQQQNYIPSQRLSEGTYHRDQNCNKMEIFQQNRFEKEPKTFGFKLCSLVNNMTKKITQSNNILGIFSEAKVNRLKKVFNQENKQKKRQPVSAKKQQIKQESQNNISNCTAPQIMTKSQQQSFEPIKKINRHQNPKK